MYARGAKASISVTTSIITGLFESIAFAKAGAKSPGFSTRKPNAPMLSATFAKLTSPKVPHLPCFSQFCFALHKTLSKTSFLIDFPESIIIKQQSQR